MAEAKAALWVQRLPESLTPATFYLGDKTGRELYRAEDVRRHLIDPDFATRRVKPSPGGAENVAFGLRIAKSDEVKGYMVPGYLAA